MPISITKVQTKTEKRTVSGQVRFGLPFVPPVVSGARLPITFPIGAPNSGGPAVNC